MTSNLGKQSLINVWSKLDQDQLFTWHLNVTLSSGHASGKNITPNRIQTLKLTCLCPLCSGYIIEIPQRDSCPIDDTATQSDHVSFSCLFVCMCVLSSEKLKLLSQHGKVSSCLWRCHCHFMCSDIY